MAIVKLPALKCDGYKCLNKIEATEKRATEQSLRFDAELRGWKHKDGYDYCPQCVKTILEKKEFC
jgi:hypothetical protein